MTDTWLELGLHWHNSWTSSGQGGPCMIIKTTWLTIIWLCEDQYRRTVKQCKHRKVNRASIIRFSCITKTRKATLYTEIIKSIFKVKYLAWVHLPQLYKDLDLRCWIRDFQLSDLDALVAKIHDEELCVDLSIQHCMILYFKCFVLNWVHKVSADTLLLKNVYNYFCACCNSLPDYDPICQQIACGLCFIDFTNIEWLSCSDQTL